MRKINTVVIAGASGFIGNYLIEEAIEQELDVYALVRKGSHNKIRCSKNKKLHIVEFDVDDMHSLITRCSISGEAACINLLWSGVAGNERGNYHTQLNNVEKSIELMEVMAELGCKTYIAASSISETEAQIYMEKDGVIAGQRFIYSIAKLATDYMSKIISLKYDITFINAKLANVYGEYGLDDLLLHSSIIKMITKQKTSYTNGEQLYDFMYVKDVARALLELARYGHNNTSYYVGSGHYRRLKEYLIYLGKTIMGTTEIGLGEIESDGISLPENVFDISKLCEHTGFVPKYAYEDVVINLINWYKEKIEV